MSLVGSLVGLLSLRMSSGGFISSTAVGTKCIPLNTDPLLDIGCKVFPGECNTFSVYSTVSCKKSYQDKSKVIGEVL